MAKIEMINQTKTMFFSGFKTKISNDPELIALARQHDNQRMRFVSNPITEEIELASHETSMLLNYVGDTCWREDFERNLQCMTAKPDGDLLTGWMSIDEFVVFLTCAEADEGEPVRDLLSRLAHLTANWKSMGVEEVYFDGYKLIK